MSRLISKIKLPAIVDQKMLEAQYLTVEVIQNLEDDKNGAGYQIKVTDAEGNVVYDCPQPCPRVIYPTS